MENDFKVGDVVKLKSGGPYLTVKFVDPQEITCLYYNAVTGQFGHITDLKTMFIKHGS